MKTLCEKHHFYPDYFQRVTRKCLVLVTSIHFDLSGFGTFSNIILEYKLKIINWHKRLIGIKIEGGAVG